MSDTDIAEQPETESMLTLQQWHLDVPVAASGGMPYIPLKTLCGYLGISSDMQVKRIKQHDIMGRYLRRFMLQTKGGKQATYCLALRVVGFWLGSISVSSVRSEIRPRLIEFQEDLIDAAQELLGDRQQESREDELARIRAQLLTHEALISGVSRFTIAMESRLGRVEHMIDPGDV